MATNPLLEPGDTEAPTLTPETESAPAPTEAQPVADGPPATEGSAPPSATQEGAGGPEASTSDDVETKYNNVRSALREERAEKQAVQQELGALRERMQQFDAMRNELDEYRKSKQVESEQAEFDRDPAGYLKQQVDQLTEQQQRAHQQSLEASQRAQQEQQFVSQVADTVNNYRAQNSDYDNAFEYVHKQRMTEYEVMGVPPQEREALFRQDSMQFAAQAMQAGRNPGELLYEMAKSRGYQQQAAPQAPQQSQQQSAEATIDRLEAGQRAAQSLSDGGQSEESLLKRVEDMSDAEFDKFWSEKIQPSHH